MDISLHYFLGSNALLEKLKLVKPVNGLKTYPERLTITPRVVKSAKSKFLIVKSKEKGSIIAKALWDPYDIASLQMILVLDATWLLDFDAADQLKAVLNKKK